MQILLQCHEEVQATGRKFHKHSLAVEVHRYLSDAMEQELRRHLPNLSMVFDFGAAEVVGAAGELRAKFAGRLMSKEGIFQTWSLDLDLYGKKGCAGWKFSGIQEQLQFPFLNRHCFL